MVVNVTGFLMDGSAWASHVDALPTPVTVASGTDVLIRVNVSTPSGRPIHVRDITEAVLSVHARTTSGPPLLKVSGVGDVRTNTLEFTLPRTLLKASKIAPGVYLYDVVIGRGTGNDLVYDQAVAPTAFVIRQTLTS